MTPRFKQKFTLEVGAQCTMNHTISNRDSEHDAGNALSEDA